MLSPSHRQPVQAKVADHVRNRSERPTELAQDEFTGLIVPLDPHVHEALGAPGRKHKNQRLSFDLFPYQYSLEGQRVVLSGTLTVPDQEATLVQRSQRVLCLDATYGPVVPTLSVQRNRGINVSRPSFEAAQVQVHAPIAGRLKVQTAAKLLAGLFIVV